LKHDASPRRTEARLTRGATPRERLKRDDGADCGASVSARERATPSSLDHDRARARTRELATGDQTAI
jgi:hypothetical protein